MIFIGKLIQDKRKEKGITQTWLNNYFNYSDTFFSKIECGTIDIPPAIVSELSRILEFNLKHIYMYSYIFSTYDEYCLYFELKDATLNSKLDIIEDIFKKYNISDDYLDTSDKSELFFMIVYAKALLYFREDKNYTINFCYRHLKIIDINNLVDLNITFDREITVYIMLITSLFDCNMHYEAFSVSLNLYTYLSSFLERTYNNAEQNIELHTMQLVIINNHAHILFSLGKYRESLYFCDEAIQKAIDYHLVFKSITPYKLKLENHYHLSEYAEAKYCIKQLKSISAYLKISYWDEIEPLIKSNYPNLLVD